METFGVHVQLDMLVFSFMSDQLSGGPARLIRNPQYPDLSFYYMVPLQPEAESYDLNVYWQEKPLTKVTLFRNNPTEGSERLSNVLRDAYHALPIFVLADNHAELERNLDLLGR